MVLPNFLIIGAAKAGTSSLHYYLSQHPQVFMPQLKEPMFFAFEDEKLNFRNPDKSINHNAVTELYEYKKLFEGVTHEIAVGEASPIYLYSRKAAKRIKHYVPNAKLIVVLRNPIDRAFSCYSHLVRERYEKIPFLQALEKEEERIKNNWAHLWHYKKGGLYYDQLKPYFDLFHSEQIRIFTYDEFNDDSLYVLRRIFDYIGVNSSFEPDMTKINVSGIPRSKLVHDFFANDNFVRNGIKFMIPGKLRTQIAGKIKSVNLSKRMNLSLEERKVLLEFFRNDISKLEKLTELDLSSWLR